MRPDDRQPPDKHQDAGEIDNGWYLGVVATIIATRVGPTRPAMRFELGTRPHLRWRPMELV